VTEFSWQDTYRRACELFRDRPNAEQEQTAIESFRESPQHVRDLIEKLGRSVVEGKIRSGWAVLRKELATDSRSPDFTVDDTSERERALRNARTWIENAGLYLDREADVEDELFGDRGPVKRWRDDERMRVDLLQMWRRLRPVGERAEREMEERLRGYGEKYAREQDAGLGRPEGLL
jgi:hypothetical protein